MLGGLHIEITIQSMIGHILKDSGWTEMLADSNLSTEGRADAMTGSDHVCKITIYGHQVTLRFYIIWRKIRWLRFIREWCSIWGIGKHNVSMHTPSFCFGT